VDRGRFEAFSDGVFAVAITLLALNLAVAGPGHGPLGHQLTNQWPAFVAYTISFFTIGIIWVNHHALFRTVPAVDRALVFMNLLLLFFVVAIPFATATMATYLRHGGSDARLAMAVFTGVFAGMSLAFGAVFLYVVGRQLLAVPLTPSMARAATLRFTIGNAVYVMAIGVAFLSPSAALAIAGAVAVYYVFERTPTATADESASLPNTVDEDEAC
jgi:uncharacterized membrane protein